MSFFITAENNSLHKLLYLFNFYRVTASYPEEKRTVQTRQNEVQELWEKVKVCIKFIFFAAANKKRYFFYYYYYLDKGN